MAVREKALHSVTAAWHEKVQVAGYPAHVRYVGETHFAPGEWIGVELEPAVGKNDGSVNEHRYFACKANHGLFVRRMVVKAAPQMPEGTEGVEPGPSSGVQFADCIAEDMPVERVQSSEDDEVTEVEEVMVPTKSIRRGGISAEAMRDQGDQWQPPVYAKSEEQTQQLRRVIESSHDSKLRMMFGNLSQKGLEKVVEAMFQKAVCKGETIIKYGDEGDNFYIVKSGRFDIFAYRNIQQADDDLTDASARMVKVFEAGEGFAFGETALLYNAPRSATITASEDSEVWCLERKAFRELVIRASEQKFKEYSEFLKQCDVFEELDVEQIATLAEVVDEEDFNTDEAIIQQGGRDSNMFIILKGQAVACIAGEKGEVQVKTYAKGDFFGEIALLLGEPRKASIYAKGDVTCLVITKDVFDRVLGPLRDFLKRNLERYAKYQDAIEQGGELREAPEDDFNMRKEKEEQPEARRVEEQSGEQDEPRPAPRRRLLKKADRAHTVYNVKIKLEDLDLEDEDAEDKSTKEETKESHRKAEEGEPKQTLAERVEQDWKKPQLVEADRAFAVPKSKYSVFGGLRKGEKFTVDKKVIVRTEVKSLRDGMEDLYRWSGPTWLKGQIHMAVVCQKGQKSAADPTPNQDNYFAHHVGPIGLYGVCDGHGPFGHLVSFRLVQSLPHFIASNPNWGEDWGLCLKEAFLAAQKELIEFAAREGFNLEASGAAGSVLIFEGPSIHVAHIGDAGCLVGSWNRHDSRVVYGAQDHKPDTPGERERLEAAGSEVRQVDVESYRIYIKGTNFPGLTMSRAFGDTACAGVLQEPHYHQMFIQPSDEFFAVIASDGIWEFIDYTKAVDLTAKKLRLKGPREAARNLVDASRKRWAAYCGEYCDDITALVVKWNVSAKGADTSTNHEFSVAHPE
ncbi:unnamed protein product [Durusdinium trenchii]|uniref:cGMP-dependent protein kinase n=1 Tax=Durusdinium trenchii TaxID=1381693 RepID=A0ABP0KAC8_9DINO